MTPLVYNSTYLTTVAVILATLAMLYLVPVLRRDLMMLQQNSYRNDRYTRWFNNSGESTRFPRILGCIALFLLLVHKFPFALTGPVAVIIVTGCLISLLSRRYKKPLVMTHRAWRILSVSLFIGWGLTAATWFLTLNMVTACAMAIAVNVLSPFIMLLANIILRPVEKSINRRYYNDAVRILRSMPRLKVVGITGSYGKTSTKHYLQRILSEEFETLMTPGSFNTTMGVIRTVREHMKPYTQVFVCEMGAKQPGDIREICQLVRPSVGIVTAVGEQHLESFKSIANVQRTKFELVDSLPDDGLAVVNDDFEFVANRPVDNVECLRYAVKNTLHADYTAADIVYGHDGTSFTVLGPDGFKLPLHTSLVGECNISNLLAAVIVALHLGVPHRKIQYAVENIQQVEHRLNMKRTPAGITIIDDAFNSNPDGSRMAVDVLARMSGGRRIIVTPGMIELGEKQYDYNRELGRHIGLNVDEAIIVGSYNRDALIDGITASECLDSSHVHPVTSFDEAQRVLAALARPGDTVLYENDLPDTFK